MRVFNLRILNFMCYFENNPVEDMYALSSQRRLGSTTAVEAAPVRIDKPIFIVRG